MFGLRAGLAALRVGPTSLVSQAPVGNCPENFERKNMFLTEKPQRTGVYGSMGYLGENRNPEEDLPGSSHSLGKGAKDFQSLRT